MELEVPCVSVRDEKDFGVVLPVVTVTSIARYQTHQNLVASHMVPVGSPLSKSAGQISQSDNHH